MKMLPGLVIGIDLKFAEVISPLTAELAPCYWLIDHQSGGPFDSSFVRQNKALFEKKRFEVPACTYSDCSCWRPHSFPRLAQHVHLDEYTSFYVRRCVEDEMRDWAVSFARRSRQFGDLEEQADLCLLYGDSWWEMYTPHPEWHRKFRRTFPKSYERSWRKAGEPPGN